MKSIRGFFLWFTWTWKMIHPPQNWTWFTWKWPRGKRRLGGSPNYFLQVTDFPKSTHPPVSWSKVVVVTLRTNGWRVGACPPSATLQPSCDIQPRDWNASWNRFIGHESTSIHESPVHCVTSKRCDSNSILWICVDCKLVRTSISAFLSHASASHQNSLFLLNMHCIARSWSSQLVTSCDDVRLARFTVSVAY